MDVQELVNRGYVVAEPVKSFFVQMLTRDIPLYDAILDLLDNCVDGIVRSNLNTNSEKPYQNFYADIEFNAESFTISDNCGGIPSNLMEYAFRLGRPPERQDAPGSVGVYGIGMKRAIFKIGRDCLLSTQNADHKFEVTIDPEWIGDETNWNIPLKQTDRVERENGTVIYITQLNENISPQFNPENKLFTEELERLISTHYAFIIEKGFRVTINNVVIEPKPTEILFSDVDGEGIKPYIFQATMGDVEVYLAVGFTIPIPSTADIENDHEENRYRSTDAGWTILCNDRAVVYRDRTELTGWGEAGIPSYHTQFIAISGIVEFKSNNPGSLPTTTTKRGIDSSSRLYLQVKNKMREGMALFTSYTNKWKGSAEDTKRHFSEARPLTLAELKGRAMALSFNETKTKLEGKQFKPNLPMPARMVSNERKITYKVPLNEYQKVAEFLLEDEEASGSDVGLATFKYVLRKAH